MTRPAGRGPWAVLILWSTAIAGCAVLEVRLLWPFPWIFLLLAVAAAATPWALRSRAGRRPTFVAAATLTALAATESSLLAFFPSPSLDRVTDYAGMLRHSPSLGSTAKPGQWTSESWVGWRQLYRASYTIGADGWRVTAPPTAPRSAESSLLCFGGSFVFGQGLDDGDSWPWRLASSLGDGVQVVNFGRPGWGPGQMLALAESPGLDDAIAAPPRLAVYLAITGHPQRVSGDASWAAGFPRYELTPTGEVRRTGNYADGDSAPERSAPERFVRRKLHRSALARRLFFNKPRGNLAPDGDAQVELWAAVVERSAEVLAERFGGLRFLVLFWDSNSAGDPKWDRQEAMIAALDERGIEVVRLSDCVPGLGSDRSLAIPFDRHPSARGAAAIADCLGEHW